MFPPSVTNKLHNPELILASTSVFRRELLARLQLPFTTVAPEVDEAPLPGETPAETAERLAVTKARAVAHLFPSGLIIGSDQVAFCGSRQFGKPGSKENAVAQLQSMRGKTVIFHTAVCLLDAKSGRIQVAGIPTEVRFRLFSDEEIHQYLEREDVLNCAGSAKSEGLGITLLDYMRSDDPTALVGLPLIALSRMLRAEGALMGDESS